MLPDELFSPLDLDDAIEDLRQAYGPPGIVDLLVVALTDPRVSHDSEIDRYLDTLKSACRQTRRYREAIVVFERIAALNPGRAPEVAAELALVHAHLGEPGRAIRLLRSAVEDQRRLPARRRSLEFFHIAELAATVLREPAMARELAAMGRTASLARIVGPATAKHRIVEEIDAVLMMLRRPRLTVVHSAAA